MKLLYSCLDDNTTNTCIFLFKNPFSFILLQIKTICIIYIIYVCKEYMTMRTLFYVHKRHLYAKIAFFHNKIITRKPITYLMTMSCELFIIFDDV